MENLMFKNKVSAPFSKLFLLSLLLLVLPLVACDTLADTAAAAPTNQTEIIAPVAAASDTALETAFAAQAAEPEVMQNQGSIVNNANSAMAPDLSIDEIADLLFMREEEKLARDVYLALYEQWGTPVFQNIAASEQVHMDAILDLINQYGLQDPAAGNPAGEFTDQTLQALYDELTAAGSRSLVDALYGSAAIEEIDILDLQGSLAQTGNSDIVPIYQSLLAGSENHLRAFVSSWERQTGETYQPQRLGQNEYTEIMSGSPSGAGNGQAKDIAVGVEMAARSITSKAVQAVAVASDV
jgi:hypothetical protein